MFVAAAIALALNATPTARLEYAVADGLAQCPDARWVQSAVTARLGRDPFDPKATTAARALIERGPLATELVAHVELERPDGTVRRRTLSSPTGDCLELASAVELALTLAIDPLWLTRKSEPKAPEEKPSSKERLSTEEAQSSPVPVEPPKPLRPAEPALEVRRRGSSRTLCRI